MFADQIVAVRELEPREAQFATAQKRMHPELEERLETLKLAPLFTHQAQSYDAAMAGKDLMVVTGTNSGKTLCYALPAIQICLTEPMGKCLFLYPTKALAQDQLGRLESLAPPSVRIGSYDGDTAKGERSSIRKLANIVLSNPDMLHIGLLPNHENWAKFFRSLRLIVIDEAHVYRGVFGANVANVLRRLLRLCESYRSRPQIIAGTATIGNPDELFAQLTGRKAMRIDLDGSPRGKRTFVFWNPPKIGENQRLSANIAASEILTSLVKSGTRTLAFSRSRVGAELVLRYTRQRLETGLERVESYRAGYTAKERRQIERDLFKGKILGLSATNSMELGVDVGTLDAVILNGYPGTISSFWQQAGRGGRGIRDGLAIYVAHDDPLEQFFLREPNRLLDARREVVTTDPANVHILANHLLCAAHERPMAPSELMTFGPTALEIAESLDRNGELEFRAGLFFYPAIEPPALKVSLKGGSGQTVSLQLENVEIGTMERSRAMSSAHTGAIYLHRGQSFLVQNLDLNRSIAEIAHTEVKFYTQSMTQSVIEPLATFQTIDLGNSGVAKLVAVRVTDSVIGFRRKSLDGDSVLSEDILELPPSTYETLAIWFDLVDGVSPFGGDVALDGAEQMGGFHGLEHALLATAPLIAGCDRGDLGSAWYSVFPDSLAPAVFVFDKTPGGVGLANQLMTALTEWLIAARGLLTTCPCADGCPGCLLSPRCEVSNEVLSKAETIKWLERLQP